MSAVECHALSKTYRSPKKAPGIVGTLKGLFRREFTEVQAVREVTMHVEEGEMVGFLGPNGAGKTTTLKMLSGILVPSAGEARVLGYRPFDRDHRMLRQIALVMGNKSQLWWDLPAWDGYVVLKELYEVSDANFKKRIDALVEPLGIADKINLQLRRLSLGERMKCELVAALLHAPRVVFLDEPTLGLDIVSQKRIREFLKELHREEGTTVLLTSHYMQDVQELCDRVIVIDHGTKVFDGTLESLKSRFQERRQVRLVLDAPVDEADLTAYGRVLEKDDEGVTLEVARNETAMLVAQLLARFPVADVQIQEISVEEVIRRLFEERPPAPTDSAPPSS